MAAGDALLSGTWTWTHGHARVLVDSAGTVRGTYDQVGLTLQRTRASVEGREMSLALTDRMGTRLRITVTDVHDGELASATIGILRWKGEVMLTGVGSVPIAGARSGDFTVGAGDAPLLRASAQGTRAIDLVFAPQVLRDTPALLPLMLLVRLYQRQMIT